ncbi:hypothetical protein BJ138DRAFT_1001804, partial [Hygrophoropsis aurantiaca]
FLQSVNERCNFLQGVLGIFYHSTCVPEKVIEVLAHAGLSVSVTSIYNAVNSMSTEMSSRIKQSVRKPFATYADRLGQPETVFQIPVHKTNQIPCRSMKIKQSTTDGNVEVMENLLQQGGIGDPDDESFNAGHDIDMSEHVLLVHGDLLTKERLDTVRDSRRIEDTPKNRLQYVVFLPGLFHYKMACADALWRTYVQPKDGRDDEAALFQHIGVLRPNETGMFASKPGFRRMHDVLHHDLWASMLNCWQIEASRHNPQWTTLEEFAAAEPSWDSIVKVSETIVQKYVAGGTLLRGFRAKPSGERDRRFENQLLRNRDELLYVDLCHAMNSGDIGRVEASFLPWIYIFKAVGKHKYAAQMSQFNTHLKYKYPEGLQKIIRNNLLCNPTGKPHAFRAVDWLVERNNLYTKVIYAGTGPNRTIDHIIKESPLIEVYRNCHVTIENTFHLIHRTIRHSPPDMTKTIQKLAQRITETSPNVFTAGRNVKYSVGDKMAEGIMLVQGEGDMVCQVNDAIKDPICYNQLRPKEVIISHPAFFHLLIPPVLKCLS